MSQTLRVDPCTSTYSCTYHQCNIFPETNLRGVFVNDFKPLGMHDCASQERKVLVRLRCKRPTRSIYVTWVGSRHQGVWCRIQYRLEDTRKVVLMVLTRMHGVTAILRLVVAIWDIVAGLYHWVNRSFNSIRKRDATDQSGKSAASSRGPNHVCFAVLDNDVSIPDVAHLIHWSALMKIPWISVWDRDGTSLLSPFMSAAFAIFVWL